MPDGVIKRPPSTGKVELPTEGNYNVIDQFLKGMMGGQDPGDLPSAVGAGMGLLPVAKLLQKLGVKILPSTKAPANMGDYLLREHLTLEDAAQAVKASPRMREFVPVGEEVVAVPGAVGKDPVQEAYERVLLNGGKRTTPKPSPPGSGGGVKHDQQANVHWPKFEDVDRLREKLGGAGKAGPDTPRRRKIPSGRPLDEPNSGPKK